ncbi:tryptophan synthase beta subunit-like PLP-dependent enzyme [Aspergillus transmontanensis]|uniref:Tryptophan synthase beta subunit-like PLP-dependent enzyme n=1 Tax=Aspergillus transmontanensis TaxID=1034304 RepID=A0A5N6WD53_9EURO|nr:tryptophan synthase beta subunit-like PLP-dependent enzyme [Aspergillus transmontanensis]
MPVLPSVDSALGAIGNTPCVQLTRVVPPGCARVFLNLESLSPTGSYKDRMALSVVEEAERRNELRRSMTVVEATGGSTGSSFAFVCALRLNTMTAFGAQLDIVPSANGNIAPQLIPAMRERARQISFQRSDYYYADQFSNPEVLPGYATLGREVLEQVPDRIDAFCGAIGGAGMVMGVARTLKEKWPACHVAVLEPASAPALTKGYGGEHSVEGIGIGFPPPLLNKDWYDEARAIEEGEGRAMCRRLAKEEGLLVGTSSGLNLGPGKTVVTVGCDTGLKYVRGNLYTED